MSLNRIIFLLLSFLLIVNFTGCDELVDDVLNQGVQVKVEEPVFQGQETSEVSSVPIVQGVHLSKAARSVAKAAYQEVAISLTDVAALVLAQDASQISFTGSLNNQGASAVQFRLYLSATGGLADPATQATLIATKSLAPGVSAIDGLNSFNESASVIAANLEAFFTANPLIDVVYVYLDAVGDGEIDVIVESLVLELGASLIKSYTLDEGDLSQYSNQVEAIESVSFTGTLDNHGAAQVLIQVYINTLGGQKIVEFTVEPGQTVTLNEDNVYFVSGGEAALENSLMNLMNDPAITSITYYMFMASTENIAVDCHITMNGSVTVTL